MNTLLKNVVRASILSLTVGTGLISSNTALADDHDHDRGWNHERRYGHYDQRGRDWDDRRWSRGPVVTTRVYVERGYAPSYAPFIDYARVIDVDPIMRRVAIDRPQQDCWVEDAQVYGRPRSHTPAILGAIIGGVVGHQFGSGHSRNVGTVAGALLGGSVGHDIARADAGVETRSVERCETRASRDWVDRVDGYRVTYVYRGRQYCTDMPYDPGSRVQVRVGDDVDVVR